MQNTMVGVERKRMIMKIDWDKLKKGEGKKKRKIA